MVERKEIGVIPYFEQNNSRQLVIVTTRGRDNRWIFPKGQPEDEISDREVAVNEAFEEAGIIGTIQGKAIKVTHESHGQKIHYKFYPFKISRICRKWPENKIRKRSLLSAEKAAKKLVKKPYAEALKQFLNGYKN